MRQALVTSVADLRELDEEDVRELLAVLGIHGLAPEHRNEDGEHETLAGRRRRCEFRFRAAAGSLFQWAVRREQGAELVAASECRHVPDNEVPAIESIGLADEERLG